MSGDGVIFKYQVRVDGQHGPIPWTAGSTRVVHVQVRDESPGTVDVWVLHPSGMDAESGVKTFDIIGTGHPFDSSQMAVVGSTVHRSTGLVWHVVQHRGVVPTPQNTEVGRP